MRLSEANNEVLKIKKAMEENSKQDLYRRFRQRPADSRYTPGDSHMK